MTHPRPRLLRWGHPGSFASEGSNSLSGAGRVQTERDGSDNVGVSTRMCVHVECEKDFEIA